MCYIFYFSINKCVEPMYEITNNDV